MKVRFPRYASSRRRSSSSASETGESTTGGFCPSSKRGILIVSTLFALNLVLLTKTFQMVKLAVLYDDVDIDLAITTGRPAMPTKRPEYVPKLTYDPMYVKQEILAVKPGSNTNRSNIFVEGFDVQRMLQTNDTSVLAAGPYYQMHEFLRTHRDKPGGRFIALLKQELYGQPDWEPARYLACYRETNLPLCLGGLHNIVGGDGRNTTVDAASTTRKDIVANLIGTTMGGRSSLGTTTASRLDSESSIEKQRSTYLPLLPASEFSSVYSLLRYQPPQYNGQKTTVSSYLIAKLEEDVNMACLPLLLAAASIDPDNGLVVELNPFAGFSSRCLAYGVQVALMKSSSVESMGQRRRLTSTTNQTSIPDGDWKSKLTTSIGTASAGSNDQTRQGGKYKRGAKLTSSIGTASAGSNDQTRQGGKYKRGAKLTTSIGTASAGFNDQKTQGGKYKRGVTNLVSYGLFQGEKMAQAIIKRSQWVRRAYPKIADPGSSDIGQLWRDTVRPVYQDAKTVEGRITEETLNNAKLENDHGHPWQVLAIDNILTSSQWHTRLNGLQKFRAGNILFWSDFQDRPEHIQMVYGCFRSTYLMPVYLSWNGKDMAFIVTRRFSSFQKPEFRQCYREVWADRDRQTDIMKARLRQDVAFLAGLSMDSAVHKHYGGLIEKKTRQLLLMLDANKAKNWNEKVTLAARMQLKL